MPITIFGINAPLYHYPSTAALALGFAPVEQLGSELPVLSAIYYKEDPRSKFPDAFYSYQMERFRLRDLTSARLRQNQMVSIVARTPKEVWTRIVSRAEPILEEKNKPPRSRWEVLRREVAVFFAGYRDPTPPLENGKKIQMVVKDYHLNQGQLVKSKPPAATVIPVVSASKIELEVEVEVEIPPVAIETLQTLAVQGDQKAFHLLIKRGEREPFVLLPLKDAIAIPLVRSFLKYLDPTPFFQIWLRGYQRMIDFLKACAESGNQDALIRLMQIAVLDENAIGAVKLIALQSNPNPHGYAAFWRQLIEKTEKPSFLSLIIFMEINNHPMMIGLREKSAQVVNPSIPIPFPLTVRFIDFAEIALFRDLLRELVQKLKKKRDSLSSLLGKQHFEEKYHLKDLHKGLEDYSRTLGEILIERSGESYSRYRKLEQRLSRLVAYAEGVLSG